MTTIAGRRPDLDRPRPPADGSLWIQVIGGARCAESILDPDDWFPVSPQPEIARREADAAIALCMACPARAQCLELSLRHWDIGQHGVWGGLVAAERAELRRRWPAREGRRRWPAREGMSQARAEPARAGGDRSVALELEVVENGEPASTSPGTLRPPR